MCPHALHRYGDPQGAVKVSSVSPLRFGFQLPVAKTAHALEKPSTWPVYFFHYTGPVLSTIPIYRPLHRSMAAEMKDLKRGCGRSGRDLNSG